MLLEGFVVFSPIIGAACLWALGRHCIPMPDDLL